MPRRRCVSIKEANAAVDEATTQIRLRHPCILTCEGVFLGGETNDGDQLVYLVTHLCDAGDLDHVVATVRLGACALACSLIGGQEQLARPRYPCVSSGWSGARRVARS